MSLSPTMEEALARAQTHGGELVRLPGGFWTYPGCPVDKRGVPTWWVTKGTIGALLLRELVRDVRTQNDLGYLSRVVSTETKS